jgi:hypothetical protein
VKVQVTGEAWINPQGRMMITLDTPEGGHAIMAVPHKDRSGNTENSQAYRTLMAAMEAASEKAEA